MTEEKKTNPTVSLYLDLLGRLTKMTKMSIQTDKIKCFFLFSLIYSPGFVTTL